MQYGEEKKRQNDNCIRGCAWDLMHWPLFHKFIFFCIFVNCVNCVNCVIMATEPQTQSHSPLFENIVHWGEIILFSVLRMARVLKPLRSMGKLMKEMKNISAYNWFKSIQPLIHVLTSCLFVFVFVVYAVFWGELIRNSVKSSLF